MLGFCRFVDNVYYRLVDQKYCILFLYSRIEFKGSNFPKLLETHFVAQSIEIARRCVEAPLKKNPK